MSQQIDYGKITTMGLLAKLAISALSLNKMFSSLQMFFNAF